MKGDAFSWRSCSVGVVAGLLIAFAIGAGTPGDGIGRYQLQAWSNDKEQFGAFRIDTWTGEVYSLSTQNYAVNAVKVEGLPGK